MSNIHLGDTISQSGHHNRMTIKKPGQQSPDVALREVSEAVRTLRRELGDQLHPTDRQLLDDSMAAVSAGAHGDRGVLRGALRNIAGLAAVVGQVGLPVLAAIGKVTAVLGL